MSDQNLHDVSRSYQLYITLSVLTFASTVSTIVRVAAKAYRSTSFSWDDYFIILGTCLNIVASGFDAKATSSGFGRHANFLSQNQVVDATHYSQLAVIVAIFAIWANKLSVCFFLLAIIHGTRHLAFRWCIRLLITFTTVTTFIVSLLWGLQAKPLPKLWDPRVRGTRVSSQEFLIINIVYYGFGVFTDVFYAASPIYFLWGVRISMRRKLTILALTGSGILVTAVGVLNIAFAHEFLNTEDNTWALVNEFICDIIERNLSGFVANLPAVGWIILRIKDSRNSSPAHTCSKPSKYDSNQHFNRGPQTFTSISSTVPSKVRHPDPYELHQDDCIPLHERKSEPEGVCTENLREQISEGVPETSIGVKDEVDVAWS